MREGELDKSQRGRDAFISALERGEVAGGEWLFVLLGVFQSLLRFLVFYFLIIIMR